LYNLTPRQFHNRLNGWREQQLVEYKERHELARLTAFLQKIETGKGKKQISVTDVMRFPWDNPHTASQQLPIKEPDSMKRYKLKLMRFKQGKQAIFNDEYEALMRQHWRPDWGPHPDELEKPKTDAHPA
jgi:hypothetical protein